MLDEVYELFMDLDAKDHQLDFPIVYCSGRDGSATLDLAIPGTDLGPLCDVIIEHIPAPEYTEGHPLQAWVTNLDANPYVGRLALCRVFEGTIRKGQQVAWCRADGTIQRAKVAELFLTKQHRAGRRSTPPDRVSSSPSPASRTSRSARRSPTPTIRGRCP